MELLLGLPAAQQLSSEAVAGLVQAAVAHDHCVDTLLKLPAAQVMNATALGQLLLLVVNTSTGCKWPKVTCQLLRLPAAQQLSGDLLGQLLEAALQNRTGDEWLVGRFLEGLVGLPGAHHISSSSMERLLQRSTAHDQQSTFQLLVNLPAAQQLSRASVARLCKPHWNVTMKWASVYLLLCQQHGSLTVQIWARCCRQLPAAANTGT